MLGVRDHQVVRPEPSPAVIEEQAANRLYGERTGTVNASPASPPVRRRSVVDFERRRHTRPGEQGREIPIPPG